MHITPSAMENLNLQDNLEKLKAKVFEHMKQWAPAPNVQMHQPPPDAGRDDDAEMDDDDADERVSRQQADRNVEHPAEFYSGKPGE